MTESAVHQLIINDMSIKKSILNLLNIDDEDSSIQFIHEDQYPNGMYADFTVKSKEKVMAIIECKGSDIGVNDYVRGIGQLVQYQHFADKSISLKGYCYSDAACSVYFLPSAVLRNRSFNIGLFKYPDKTKILELNEINKNIRLVTKNELDTLALAVYNDLITISQYYIRDNRLYELYLCLKYCQFLKIQGHKYINRKDAEINFLRKLNTPNNKNWRNAFISLSSLGLINDKNLPTNIGAQYANKEFSEFCLAIYQSYIRDYIDLLINILFEFSSNMINVDFSASNNEICSKIDKLFRNKKVLFLTDSKNRYLSSWLNIMRDDFMCLEFNSRCSIRKILYNITEYNDNAIIKHINNNEVANSYINNFHTLLI